MKDKYYTPEISEFYIGFEYEEQDFTYYDLNIVDDIWNKEIYNLDHFLDVVMDGEWEFDLKSNIEEGRIRVKYLNDEDIKSLGFAYISNSDMFIGSTKNYFTYITPIEFSYGTVLKIEVSVEKESEKTLVVHSILIKNKSELKKLLKQIGIDETS